jgi:hypothetical protein
MTDTAHLAAAIRQVIDDAVPAALRAPAQLPPEPPNPAQEWPPDRMLYPLNEIQQKLGVGRTTVYQLIGGFRVAADVIGRTSRYYFSRRRSLCRC